MKVMIIVTAMLLVLVSAAAAAVSSVHILIPAPRATRTIAHLLQDASNSHYTDKATEAHGDLPEDESGPDSLTGGRNLSGGDTEVEGEPTWHGVLREVRQSVREGHSAAPTGTGHATGDRRGGHLPVDSGVVGEAACSVSHGHPPFLRQGRRWAPLPEGC